MHRPLFFFGFLCILAQSLNAQEYPAKPWPPAKCSIPSNNDSWSLEPSIERPGEYEFTYINKLEKCSNELNGITVETSDGFRVRLFVEIGVNESQDEKIYVIPEDIQYMPFPLEIIAPDSSEPYKIRLIPGLS